MSGGDQWRPFIHVEDAAAAVLRVLESRSSLVAGETFNVGSNDQNHTIQQVREAVQKQVPTAQLVDIPFDRDRCNYRVSFDRIYRLLYFAPSWTLERGIRQVIDAIASGLVNDYRDPRYSNVRVLGEGGIIQRIPRTHDWAYRLIRGDDEVTPTRFPDRSTLAPALLPKRAANDKEIHAPRLMTRTVGLGSG